MFLGGLGWWLCGCICFGIWFVCFGVKLVVVLFGCRYAGAEFRLGWCREVG